MANNDPADDGGQRNGVEHAVQIATEGNQQLDSLEEALHQLGRIRCSTTGPANITGARIIMLICGIIKFIRQKLISEMGRQDIDPGFLLVYALISVALGCIECSLLMYNLLGDMPWPIFIPCVLMLVILFVFIAN